MVRLEITDQPSNKRLWWFINENGAVELCVEDPGDDVDLYLAATLPDLIYIYNGDLPLPRALSSGRLEALGDARARRALIDWFNLGPRAAVPSMREDGFVVAAE